MSNIPNSKWGDCTRCPAKNCACRKRGKYLVCLPCCQKEDNDTAIKKAAERDAERRILTGNDQDMKEWYAMVTGVIAEKPYCWECGEFIPMPNLALPKKDQIDFYHAASAHILFKSIFDSVKAHPYNFLVLGAGCCHDKSHRMDTFSKMKVFPLAVKRFRLFEGLITEKHALLDEFLKYANELSAAS